MGLKWLKILSLIRNSPQNKDELINGILNFWRIKVDIDYCNNKLLVKFLLQFFLFIQFKIVFNNEKSIYNLKSYEKLYLEVWKILNKNILYKFILFCIHFTLNLMLIPNLLPFLLVISGESLVKVWPKYQKCPFLGKIHHGYGSFWSQSVGPGPG